MSSRALTWVAGGVLALVLAFAVTVVAHADRSDKLPKLSTPQGTVQSFLTDALVEQNPVTACSYLTPNARKSFEPAQDCTTFFGSARLDAITSDRQVQDLTYRVSGDGAARVVGVDGLTFVVRPATAADQTEFHAPPTTWRIDSSVSALAG